MRQQGLPRPRIFCACTAVSAKWSRTRSPCLMSRSTWDPTSSWPLRTKSNERASPSRRFGSESHLLPPTRPSCRRPGVLKGDLADRRRISTLGYTVLPGGRKEALWRSLSCDSAVGGQRPLPLEYGDRYEILVGQRPPPSLLPGQNERVKENGQGRGANAERRGTRLRRACSCQMRQ